MYKLFGLNFYAANINDLTLELNKNILLGNKVSVFTPNIDHIINNYENENVNNNYSKSEYIIADGWPLVAVAKAKKKNIQRITGVDLMDNLLNLANKNRYNIYFLGATDKTLDKLVSNIRNSYPDIGYIGTNNGFFSNSNNVIRNINKNNIDILFVGMGNPKQEIWIRENFESINSKVMLAVGGAFNIYSGDLERAPKWIQNIGMEWFYRFLKEPKRLFYRYFIKYPKFFKIFLKELISNEN